MCWYFGYDKCLGFFFPLGEFLFTDTKPSIIDLKTKNRPALLAVAHLGSEPGLQIQTVG